MAVNPEPQFHKRNAVKKYFCCEYLLTEHLENFPRTLAATFSVDIWNCTEMFYKIKKPATHAGFLSIEK